MTTIPKNLVEQLVTILNANSRVAITRDSQDLQRVRVMLVEAGCIEETGLYDCAVVADGCGQPVCTGCVDCGRHGVHNDEGLCNDCRGPVDGDDFPTEADLAAYADEYGCVGCGSLYSLNDQGACASCAKSAAEDHFTVCIGCGGIADCDEEQLCAMCGG
jgi:hypothetical protein